MSVNTPLAPGSSNKLVSAFIGKLETTVVLFKNERANQATFTGEPFNVAGVELVTNPGPVAGFVEFGAKIGPAKPSGMMYAFPSIVSPDVTAGKSRLPLASYKP
jgi:hypothetical protein